MRRSSIPIVLSLLVSALLVGLPSARNTAHGLTAGPATMVSVTPPIIANLSRTSGTVTFSINVMNSPAITAFAVWLEFNPTVLPASTASINYTGNVLGSTANVQSECVNGIPIVGSCTFSDPSLAGPGIISLALFLFGNKTTTPVTNGLLFHLTLTIARSGFSQLHFLQVLLVNGVLGKSFSSARSDGYFTNLDCPTGGKVLCRPPLASYTVSPAAPSVGQILTFNASASASQNSGGSILTYNWSWGDGSFDENFSSPIATHTFSAAGDYLVTLRVTDRFGIPWASTTTISVNSFPDFSVQSLDSALTLPLGTSVSPYIIVDSLNGFAGTIKLSSTVTPSNGPVVTIPSSSVTVSPSSPRSIFRITISAPSSIAQQAYAVQVFGTNGTLTRSATITVTVRFISPDFQIAADPPALLMVRMSQSTSIITATSVGGFTGNLTLKVTFFGSEIQNVSLSPQGLRLTLGGTATTLLTVAADNSLGSTTIGFTASNGTLSHVINISVTVVGPPADFLISTNTTSLTLPMGAHGNATVALSSVNGFAGNITLAGEVSPVTFPSPSVTLNPNIIELASGSIQHSLLTILVPNSTIPRFYSIIITATSDQLVHSLVIRLQVPLPPDEPPVASFHVSPANPILGQTVQFDGSTSYDPDGSIQLWTWNPGDGYGTVVYNYPFFYHTYSATGNFTVTLTVSDSFGQTASTNMTVQVRSQPVHDVSIIYLSTEYTKVVATTLVGLAVQVRNDGYSNETVTVTAYANGRAVQTLTGIFIQGCRISQCYNQAYLTLFWDTTGTVPGNYTISASVSLPTGEVDPTPSDNSFTNGIVMILPAPILTISPASGSIGAQVVIQGTGFLFSGPKWITFDDMFLGYAFNINNGTFTFTLDVPQAQPGTHMIKALDPYTGAHGSTKFTVTSTQTGSLTVTVNTGSVYFPGDTVVVYVYTSFNGVAKANSQVTVQLVFSNGTSRNLTVSSLATGLYKATYTIPQTGPLGTYALVGRAHMAGPIDASSLTTFEVKLNWLSSNRNNVITATTLACVIGLVGIAWKKGYLRGRDESESSSPPDW